MPAVSHPNKQLHQAPPKTALSLRRRLSAGNSGAAHLHHHWNSGEIDNPTTPNQPPSKYKTCRLGNSKKKQSQQQLQRRVESNYNSMSVVVGQNNNAETTNISKSGLIMPPASMARQLSGTSSTGGGRKHNMAEPNQSSSALPLPSRRQKPFMKPPGRSKKKKITILSQHDSTSSPMRGDFDAAGCSSPSITANNESI